MFALNCTEILIGRSNYDEIYAFTHNLWKTNGNNIITAVIVVITTMFAHFLLVNFDK